MVFVFMVLAALTSAQEPDWIPVGTLPDDQRSLLLATAIRLETTNTPAQIAVLDQLRASIRQNGPDFGAGVIPILRDIVKRDRVILSLPDSYHVSPRVKLLAIDLISEIHGEDAYQVLAETLSDDRDGSVRAHAATRLADSSMDKQAVLVLVTNALAATIRSGSRQEEEIAPYLAAIERILKDPWVNPTGELADALIAITNGSYSRAVRRSASTLLAVLIER